MDGEARRGRKRRKASRLKSAKVGKKFAASVDQGTLARATVLVVGKVSPVQYVLSHWSFHKP